MTQIFIVHSIYGLATAVAAIDAGIVPDASRRILAFTNTAAIPETAPDLLTDPGLAGLRRRFTDEESLNDMLAPLHPTQWRPGTNDSAIVERLVRRAWNLGSDPVHLFVQSVQVPPARSFVWLFPGAEVTILGDGLMTYSPIRDRISHTFTHRVTGVTYADVVPGVEPLLFTEHGAARLPISPERFGATLREATEDLRDPAVDLVTSFSGSSSLVLGQYLSTLGLMTTEEETELQQQMIARAHAFGADRVVFKPHPSAPPTETHLLAEYGRAIGARVDVLDSIAPAEIVADRIDAKAVVAGFSTALPTTRAMRGTPIASVGMESLLERLQPYANSNRIPATIVDALTREDALPETDLQHLVDTVGYVMQPVIMKHLRPRAVEFLQHAAPRERERYVGQRQLRRLDLPGAVRQPWHRLLDTSVGSRLETARLMARGAKRRTRRAWKELRGR